MSTILAFNKWPTEGIIVEDPGLKDYITLQPKIVPKSSGRHMGYRFYKSKVFIVERFMNKLMVPGHRSKKHFKSSGFCTGKSGIVYKILLKALERVEETTKENPVKVFVKAVENAAPREEIITIEYGGARYPKAIECAPQRRVDIALRYFAQGAYLKSFNTKKLSVQAVADEILNAYNGTTGSLAIAKKQEIERQADALR